MSGDEPWRLRREAWERFAAWRPPVSVRERETRLDWLQDALALAARLGRLEPRPPDSAEDLARRRRIRDALARIRA